MRGILALLLLAALPAHALEDGAWDAGVWASSTWASGVWYEAGGDVVAVPNVEGLSATDADTALESDGLDTGAVSMLCSDQPVDEVLDQDPEAGTVVALGSLVDLLTSTGVACPAGPANTGKNVHSISINIGIRL